MYSVVRGWPWPLIMYRTVNGSPIDNGVSEWAGDDSILYRPKFKPFRLIDSDPNDATWRFAEPPELIWRGCLLNVLATLFVFATVAAILEFLQQFRQKRLEARVT
ncbi:MAG TPA: hypothetical protein VEK08_22335 [Planctomycetota bacterium]|nr:hypothetical protein [Planctomycetota bacterium]